MFENKVVPLRQKDEIDDPLTCPTADSAWFDMGMIRFGRFRRALGRSRWKSPRRGIAVDCLEGKRAGASICVTPLMELSRGQITPRPLPILG